MVPRSADGHQDCLFCKKSVKSYWELETHTITHTKEERPKTCSKIRPNVKQNKPSVLRTGRAPVRKFFRCFHCAATFKSESSIKSHYKSYHKVKLFNCDLCSNWYLSERSVLRHKRKAHGVTGPTFNCEPCGITFPSVIQLWNHKKAVHLAKTHECRLCKRVYSSAWSLTRHVKKNHASGSSSSSSAQKKISRLDKHGKITKSGKAARKVLKKAGKKVITTTTKKKIAPVKKTAIKKVTQVTDQSPVPSKFGEGFTLTGPMLDLASFLEREAAMQNHYASFFLHMNRYAPE